MPVPTPPRMNLAGVCCYCLHRDCEKPSCIKTYAATTWEVCTRCGGTEYIDGHRYPEDASERCRWCHGGLSFTLTSPER
ncbi:hypothetical protein ATK86_3321 [Nocardia fluminea]|uniref:Uncharacterized protein n=1 Tax=Nocardia fluminea TaxID=134984 RepID=A0A2N3VBI9_9NOCA|nr:hypothetical protein ATK86_3321 [Nocardia fluminea]